MRFQIFLIALNIVGCRELRAQERQYGLETTALGRRVINRQDTVYIFYVKKPEEALKVDRDKTYYWFKSDTIITTTGGYDGWVLNGDYKMFFPGKGMRQSGFFQMGLKDGEWKTWYEDGRLQSVSRWKKGVCLDIEKDKKTNQPL
jgi:antitoxin component YwqK of YwqJK toxin-antitoxin module